MSSCQNCPWRKKYDRSPHSLLGRLWRWHINWCPGFKKFLKELDESQRLEIEQKYSLKE